YEEAAEIFAALHDRQPDDEAILEYLERALRMGDDARGLCDLLERRAGWESDDERRVAMLFERASLLEEVLDEPIQACDLYQAIAENEADTDHARMALARLESLLESQAEWSRLRTLLSSKIESTPATERATLRERIAQICSDRLDDMAGCAEQFEAIAETSSDQIHVWQRLEEIYRHELDRPVDWLRVVEAELDAEPSDERELTLRVGAARLFLDDAKRPRDREAAEALSHYERVLELNPSHGEAAEVLVAHYGCEGRWDESARILEARLEGMADSRANEKIELQLRLADLLSNHLEQKPRALTHYEAMRERLGALPKIAEPLAELYEQAGRFEDLNRLAREVLKMAEADQEPVAWRVRLAASERALGQLDAAAVAYRVALGASPVNREIEDALIEIYEQVGEFEPLAELLEKRLPFAQVEEAIELRLRLARLYGEGHDDPAAALEQLELVLDMHPGQRDAFASAFELADRIGDPKRLLELLDRALATTLPALDRAELLERRGLLIAERPDDSEQALPCFREAIVLDPTRESARLALRVQLERLQRWPAVLDCLFVEASKCDAERRVDLYERAAEIACSHISPDASLPWLTRLRKERPEDPELLSRLAKIHGRAGRWEAALRALSDELELRPNAEDQIRLHAERARLLERELHAPGRAVLAYQRAFEIGPAGEERDAILSELDRLYTQMDRPLERAEILEARVANLDGKSGIALRQTLASIYCVDLVKHDLAIRPLLINVDATRDKPNEQMTHLVALDAALRAGARHDAWARVAEQELELIDTHEDIRESTPEDYQRFLREELAHTYDEELGNSNRA
ncbi:MAG: tetratricopeptide repeat protein, partial [Myxococcota bacterium]